MTLPLLSHGELVSKLARLANDEELPLSARTALHSAVRADLGALHLETILHETFDVLAGMSTHHTLIRIVHDLIMTDATC